MVWKPFPYPGMDCNQLVLIDDNTLGWDDLVSPNFRASGTVILRYPQCWPEVSHATDLLKQSLFVVRLGTEEVDDIVVTDEI